MGKPAEARFHTADDQGEILPAFPHPAAVDNGRPVGPQPRLPSRGIAVAAPAFFRRGKPVEHGIQVPCRHQGRKTGASHGEEGLAAPPVWLGKNAYPVSPALKNPGDDRRAEAGVVYVGISADQQKIKPRPSSRFHLFPVHRKEGSPGNGRDFLVRRICQLRTPAVTVFTL